MHSLRKRLVWVLTLIVFCVSTADAHVTRVELLSREDVQSGRAFGLAGAYERIIRRGYFAGSPENVHHPRTFDVDKAPPHAPRGEELSPDPSRYRPEHSI